MERLQKGCEGKRSYVRSPFPRHLMLSSSSGWHIYFGNIHQCVMKPSLPLLPDDLVQLAWGCPLPEQYSCMLGCTTHQRALGTASGCQQWGDPTTPLPGGCPPPGGLAVHLGSWLTQPQMAAVSSYITACFGGGRGEEVGVGAREGTALKISLAMLALLCQRKGTGDQHPSATTPNLLPGAHRHHRSLWCRVASLKPSSNITETNTLP